MAGHGVVSADSHVTEPADLWEKRLDRRFRDRSPRVIENPGVALGARLRRRLRALSFGADNYMWASDFPHSDSTFPESRAWIEKNFAGFPPA